MGQYEAQFGTSLLSHVCFAILETADQYPIILYGYIRCHFKARVMYYTVNNIA